MAIIRAVLIGLVVSLAGQLPWSILVTLNLRSPHSPPWAAFVMAAYLILYWRYLNGWGWPKSNSLDRRKSFRACNLSPEVWFTAMPASVLAVAIAVALQSAFSKLVPMPASKTPDVSDYAPFTLVLLLVMGGAVAGIAEEAGFRGYMQSMIERAHGPVVAITIVSVVFAATHFTHGVANTLPRVPYYIVISAIYGVLTYRTGSILPAMIIHGSGDALEYLLMWQKAS